MSKNNKEDEVPTWAVCIKEMGRLGREVNNFNPWQGLSEFLRKDLAQLLFAHIPSDQRDAFKCAVYKVLQARIKRALEEKLGSAVERDNDVSF